VALNFQSRGHATPLNIVFSNNQLSFGTSLSTSDGGQTIDVGASGTYGITFAASCDSFTGSGSAQAVDAQLLIDGGPPAPPIGSWATWTSTQSDGSLSFSTFWQWTGTGTVEVVLEDFTTNSLINYIGCATLTVIQYA
jgi:hypothetical protein